jgi:Zn-dependent M28 family amino/carboxypeptidase
VVQRVRTAAIVLAVLLVAGCIQSDVPTPTDPQPTSSIAPVKVDAAKTLADLRSFSEQFPARQYESQTHLASREWLANAFKAAGLEVVRQKFPVSAAGPNGAYQGENIIGIHWGSVRHEWIVVGGHYDVTDLAAQGTYDDGSGTLMTVRLAQAYASVPTERTLVFIPFDQEEKGLVGSAFFVKTLLENKFQYQATVVAMIDLDMVGITYPHPADLVCQENSDEIKALAESARKAAKVPDDSIQYRPPLGGTSDGASFMRRGIPTLYCWSNWDEVVLKDGTKMQGSYPWWHRADTYQTMLAMAGDEATLQAGFQTVLDIVSPVLAQLSDASTVVDTRA